MSDAKERWAKILKDLDFQSYLDKIKANSQRSNADVVWREIDNLVKAIGVNELIAQIKARYPANVE